MWNAVMTAQIGTQIPQLCPSIAHEVSASDAVPPDNLVKKNCEKTKCKSAAVVMRVCPNLSVRVGKMALFSNLGWGG